MSSLSCRVAVRTACLVALAGGSVAAGAQSASERARALFREEWQFELREDPLFATYAGDHRYDDRLPSVSADDEARRAAARRKFLKRLHEIHRESLTGQDRVSYDLLGRQLNDAVTDYEFGSYQIPITVDEGFHIDFSRLYTRVPLDNTAEYERYLARLRAWPKMVSQEIDVMRMGLARGFTVPKVTLQGYEGTISAHVVMIRPRACSTDRSSSFHQVCPRAIERSFAMRPRKRFGMRSCRATRRSSTS